MHDAEAVRRLERRGDLSRDVERTARSERCGVDLFAEQSPFDVLEHEKEGAVVEATEIRRGDDVRMLDVRDGARFSLEAGDDVGDGGELAVQHLDGHALSHVDVLTEVDTSHRTFAEERIEPIALA